MKLLLKRFFHNTKNIYNQTNIIKTISRNNGIFDTKLYSHYKNMQLFLGFWTNQNLYIRMFLMSLQISVFITIAPTQVFHYNSDDNNTLL